MSRPWKMKLTGVSTRGGAQSQSRGPERVGLAADPVDGPLDQDCHLSAASGSRCGGGQVGLAWIAQVDAPANVEGGRPGIADEVVQPDCAQQAKGEPVELGILRAAVVALADRREKLIH